MAVLKAVCTRLCMGGTPAMETPCSAWNSCWNSQEVLDDVVLRMPVDTMMLSTGAGSSTCTVAQGADIAAA